jgi:hypothetical protein
MNARIEWAESGAADGTYWSAGREQLIAEAAYYRAERRGFQPGHELEDWLAAEAEVDGEDPTGKPDPDED